MSDFPLPQGGFTWGALGAWGSFLTLLGVVARQVGPWRTQSINAEKSFRDDLLDRVVKLEGKLEEKDREAKVERALHDAERAVDRHRINNLQQMFDAVLMMIEAQPERAVEIVAQIKLKRAEQLKAEAIEKAAIHTARIGIAGGPD